ncbi:hypothetical protein ACVXZW_14470 [Lacticaseibacillus paracasei]|uniref:Phage protein n=1 Tax=Lacticaseibacillus paracasei subsp. paracasei Lpp7 TaxID=1256200 RepID=A0A8E0M8Z7_LACPA|nr:hypothetical protein [Lacticaseibacillus paracasei]EPC51919.1 hypothetical protein Lpp7_07992 [Lacticaseibacillus paracasei subsp. paracasei Lpp7]
MSNETKRDVLKKALDFLVMSGIERSTNYDMERYQYLSEYDAALPDDLPVIPEDVSEWLTWCKRKHHSLKDALDGETRVSEDVFALAWVLGVWRVEETGEIVKLEA